MSTLYRWVVGILITLSAAAALHATVKPHNCAEVAVLIYGIVWTFKVTLDDSAHFENPQNQPAWAHGLGLSIVWTLFMVNSWCVAAADVYRALLYALFAHVIGVLWLAQNYLHKREAAELNERRRHAGWMLINGLNILALATANTYDGQVPNWAVAVGVSIFTVATLVDILYFRTFPRIVEAFAKKGTVTQAPISQPVPSLLITS